MRGGLDLTTQSQLNKAVQTVRRKRRLLIFAAATLLFIAVFVRILYVYYPLTYSILYDALVNPRTWVDQSTTLGIAFILALSLNIEFGYTGIPNFGKIFFVGIGAFLTGAMLAHILSWLADNSLDICSQQAAFDRFKYISLSTASFNFGIHVALPMWSLLLGLFVLTLVASGLLTGVFGFIFSYPALRLKEDYLGIMLIASGELLRVFALGLPGNVIACESDSLTELPKPFIWLFGVKLPPPLDDPVLRVDGAFALVVLLIAVIAYIVISRITNSPYGRMLKSVRDDEQAARTLGKDAAKVRGQAMIIGSALAGVAGALITYQLSSVSTEYFIPLQTFLVWAVVLIGGAANNRGVILGALAYFGLNFSIFLTRTTLGQTSATFALLEQRAPIDTYLEIFVLGVLVISLILFRPQGLLPEKPVKTPAWDVLDRASDSERKPAD